MKKAAEQPLWEDVPKCGTMERQGKHGQSRYHRLRARRRHTSGAAVVGAIKVAKQLNLGKDNTVVVVLPDSLRNYITKVPSSGKMG